MNLFNLFILSIIFIVTSVITTSIIRNFSIKNNLLDIPNERSSHRTPKPKGGGISIVGALIFTIVILFQYEMIASEITISMVIGLVIVSIVALINDYKNLSPLIRTVIYIISAGFSLYIIDGFESVVINNYSYNLGYIGYCLGILFLVWLTNLYNFMDGTDGFAATQTICVSLFCFYLFYLSNNIPFFIIMLCLVSTTIGFLFWNWSPAKIFMGDVGSCSIGFFFGLLSIYTENKGIISITVWVILLAPFIADATFTLIKRVVNNEKWYEAHNSHAYQKLHKHGISHSQIASCLFVINVAVIWPIAYFAHTYKNYELFMLILSYILTAFIWLIIQSKYREST
jgi:Fuc2NAc and GlcNAc transferase